MPAGPWPLAASAVSAVAVTGVLAYSNGFEFFVTSFLRPDNASLGDGRGAPPSGPRTGGPAAAEPLEIGLGFADGGQVFRNEPPPGDDEPAGPILHFGAAFGTTYRSDAHWWAWPLPPPGRLDFICRLGGVETRASLDAQLILDAARQSRPAWPGA